MTDLTGGELPVALTVRHPVTLKDLRDWLNDNWDDFESVSHWRVTFVEIQPEPKGGNQSGG